MVQEKAQGSKVVERIEIEKNIIDDCGRGTPSKLLDLHNGKASKKDPS